MKAGQVQPTPETEVRRRGRPSVLSKEGILQAALDLAAADPLTPVSVKMIARQLNVSSMAIYTYFASRDELLQAMSARLLEGFRFDPAVGTDPLAGIRSWLYATRDHLLAHKQLINLLSWDNGKISVAWKNHMGPLFNALRRCGLEGDVIAQTALWITISGVSTTILEIRTRLADSPSETDDIFLLNPDAAAGRAMMNDFQGSPDHHARLFDFIVKQLIEAVRHLAEDRKSG